MPFIRLQICFFISVFGKNKIHQLFSAIQNKHLGIWGIIPASLLGIDSHLCMYGTIPIAASLSEKGIHDDYLAAFMMSSILLNPQLLIYSAALGNFALCVRFISCFLCGIVAGILIRFFYKENSFFHFDGFSENVNRDIDPNLFLRLLKNIGRNIKATGVYFLFGILLSALFQRYVLGADAFASLFVNHEGFGLLMAATIGIPLYVCGGGTIPLLQQWITSGMSMGSAAAFMITRPYNKNYKFRCIKNCSWHKKFCYLFCFYYVVFIVM